MKTFTLAEIKTDPDLSPLWLDNPKNSDEIKRLDIAIYDKFKFECYTRPMMAMEVFRYSDPTELFKGTPKDCASIHKELASFNAVTIHPIISDGRQVGRMRFYCLITDAGFNPSNFQ